MYLLYDGDDDDDDDDDTCLLPREAEVHVIVAAVD